MTIKELLDYAGFQKYPEEILDIKLTNIDYYKWFEECKIDEAIKYYGLDKSKEFMSLFTPYLTSVCKDKTLLMSAYILNEYLFSNDNYGNVSFVRNQKDMFSALVILSGYNKHRKNMKSKNFDKEQEFQHKKEIYTVCAIRMQTYNINYLPIGFVIWAKHFINTHIIQVGRLQYEIKKYKYMFENIDIKKDDFCIGVHIPREGKLDDEEVKKSFDNAKAEVYKYFPQIKGKAVFCCNSWLLGKELYDILPSNSNIAKFRDRFSPIYSTKESSITKFLFDEIAEKTDFSLLPENSSLRKKVKQCLIWGQIFYDAVGIVKDY